MHRCPILNEALLCYSRQVTALKFCEIEKNNIIISILMKFILYSEVVIPQNDIKYDKMNKISRIR